MLEDLDALMEQEGIDTLLTRGNAFEMPDMYWLTGFRSPDNIVYIKNRGEEPVVASAFNTLSRVSKESFVKRTHDLSSVFLTLLKENKMPIEHPDVVYGAILKELFAGKVLGLPDNISARIFSAIQKLGYTVKIVPDLIKDARATKSDREIKTVKRAGDATVSAMAQVVEMVKDATIGPNKTLLFDGEPLTVRKVKLALEHFLLDRGAESAEDAIVAVGRKSFDWHYLGNPKDKMKAGVPIIIDVFPRLKIDRYVADVTRTIVKGKPSSKVQLMFDAVNDACDAAVDAITEGAKIDDANLACANALKIHGFDSTRLTPEAKEGMTHGLGHGIGLEVHENPSLYKREKQFITGHVLAIEPGVYLKTHGGVRIENDYVVTKRKARRLTKGLDGPLYL